MKVTEGTVVFKGGKIVFISDFVVDGWEPQDKISYFPLGPLSAMNDLKKYVHKNYVFKGKKKK